MFGDTIDLQSETLMGFIYLRVEKIYLLEEPLALKKKHLRSSFVDEMFEGFKGLLILKKENRAI